MVKIDRLPSGSWRARINIGGGKYKTFTGADKKDVQLRAAEFEAGILKQNPNDSMTFAEAVGKYIEIKNQVLSPATIRGYDTIRKNSIESLANIKIKDITAEKIQSAINEVSASGLKPKTCKNIHCLISAVMKMYKPELHLGTTLPQMTKSEVIIPQEDEIRELLVYFQGTNMEVPFMLGAFCGMRESEITGLTWGDIDFENNRIRIKQALVRGSEKYVMKGTKSFASERNIRLFPFVKEAILKHPGDDSTARVSKLLNNTIYKKFVSALEELGLPHYRFHDLRHYCVSAMLSQNVPKNYIVDYVGHASENMVNRVYGHIMRNKKDDVEEIMEEYFEKSVMKSVTKNKKAR